MPIQNRCNLPKTYYLFLCHTWLHNTHSHGLIPTFMSWHSSTIPNHQYHDLLATFNDHDILIYCQKENLGIYHYTMTTTYHLVENPYYWETKDMSYVYEIMNIDLKQSIKVVWEIDSDHSIQSLNLQGLIAYHRSI